MNILDTVLATINMVALKELTSCHNQVSTYSER